jgi:hypothetical protein
MISGKNSISSMLFPFPCPKAGCLVPLLFFTANVSLSGTPVQPDTAPVRLSSFQNALQAYHKTSCLSLHISYFFDKQHLSKVLLRQVKLYEPLLFRRDIASGRIISTHRRSDFTQAKREFQIAEQYFTHP